MSTSQDEETPPKTNCFSAILRRLLCSGSLPTHPTTTDQPLNPTDHHHGHDHRPISINDPTKTDQNNIINSSINSKQTTTPNIVAKLMGLDSFPSPDRLYSKQSRSLGSILRSRSVNYIDYLPQFGLTTTKLDNYSSSHRHHRRVRTSVSFREVPTFLSPQNHDFFLVCFDEDGKTSKCEVGFLAGNEKASTLKRKKKVRGGREKQEVKGLISRKKLIEKKQEEKQEYQEREVVTRVCRPRVVKDSSSGRRSKPSSGKAKIKEAHHVVEQEVKKPCRPRKEEVEEKYKPRSRKYKHPRHKVNVVREGEVFISSTNNHKRENLKKRREVVNGEFLEMLMDVCKLAGEDAMISGLGWRGKEGVLSSSGEFEEICFDFGEEILQLLLSQVVDELCVGCH